MEFDELLSIIRNLNFKSYNDWWYFINSNENDNIPKNPNIIFKDKGWISWKHFLNIEKVDYKLTPKLMLDRVEPEYFYTYGLFFNNQKLKQ